MRASNASTTVTAGSSRRAQPVRQTRTNPPRSSAVLPRSFNGGRTVDQTPSTNEPPGFFPAITYFTDAITALPKEVIRHLTLLKEVDAKAFGPEEQLFRLVEAALATPILSRQPSSTAARAGEDGNGGTASQKGDGSDHLTQSMTTEVVAPDSAVNDAEELARRSLFYQLHMVANEMIPTLDEKIQVLSPATEALNKQLARLDSSFPYVEAEISEEARYGSLTHWAYTDKGNGVTGTGAPERQRRDVAVANSLAASAAAYNNDTEAAARSELRREAMLAKRRRDHHADSDADDHHHGGRQRLEGPKKGAHTKVKKTVEGGNNTNLGLGVSNGAGLQNPPTKKRKTEKTALAGTGVMTERSIASVYPGNSSKHGAVSPHEGAGFEGPKKRQRTTPAQPGATRKRHSRCIHDTNLQLTVIGTTRMLQMGSHHLLPRLQSMAHSRGTQKTVEIALLQHLSALVLPVLVTPPRLWLYWRTPSPMVVKNLPPQHPIDRMDTREQHLSMLTQSPISRDEAMLMSGPR
jgi:hypothetical protein